SLTLGQRIVIQSLGHRIEVVAADPRALDVKARPLEDPEIWHIVENRAGSQVEEVLDPRRLVQLARRCVDEGVQRVVAVSDPCWKRAASAKERRDGVQGIREPRRPREQGEGDRKSTRLNS